MHFLILCILSSTGIFVVFKSLERYSIPSFPIIVINYFAATMLGFFINRGQVTYNGIKEMDWLAMSVIIGILFIIMFFLVALSTRKAGISVTTVASKMSVIFPIVFSLIIDASDQISFIKIAAIICTLGGVFLTVYKPNNRTLDKAVLYIPIILFFGMGLVDSLVKFAQHRFVNDSDTALFSAVLFLNAFVSGIVVLIFFPAFHKSMLKPKIWGWGLLLGVVNFGSIYFLVRALNYVSSGGFRLDSSVVFGINNIGIVALSVFIGRLIFKERLQPLNWLGIILSLLALLSFTFG